MHTLYKIIYWLFVILKFLIYLILTTILILIGNKSILRESASTRKDTKKLIRFMQKKLNSWVK